MRSHGLFLALAALGALALSTTSADAATFSGCFKNSPGKPSKVRPSSVLVDQTPACKSTETLQSWNEEGPEGPQGPSGTANCSPEEFAGTNQPNTFSVLNASCSSGKAAVSAAAIWHTPFDAADNGPFYFFPRSGSLWTVIPYNHTAQVQEYRFFLQCCN
jgi:hypothetical protein